MAARVGFEPVTLQMLAPNLPLSHNALYDMFTSLDHFSMFWQVPEKPPLQQADLFCIEFNCHICIFKWFPFRAQRRSVWSHCNFYSFSMTWQINLNMRSFHMRPRRSFSRSGLSWKFFRIKCAWPFCDKHLLKATGKRVVKILNMMSFFVDETINIVKDSMWWLWP